MYICPTIAKNKDVLVGHQGSDIFSKALGNLFFIPSASMRITNIKHRTSYKNAHFLGPSNNIDMTHAANNHKIHVNRQQTLRIPKKTPMAVLIDGELRNQRSRSQPTQCDDLLMRLRGMISGRSRNKQSHGKLGDYLNNNALLEVPFAISDTTSL